MRDWARIKKAAAGLFNLLRGEREPSLWWAKVHGKNKSGQKINLTIYRPMPIDQIADMPGMEEFMSVSDFEYRDSYDRDSVFGMQDNLRSKKVPAYWNGKVEITIPYPVNEVHFIDQLGIDDRKSNPLLLATVNEKHYGWDDPEYGEIFKKIDMLKEREGKKSKPRKPRKPKPA